MDGAELANQLRVGRPDLPVIYLSGYSADTDVVATLRDEPGARFLEKPFRSVALLERIAEALGGRSPVSEPDSRNVTAGRSLLPHPGTLRHFPSP